MTDYINPTDDVVIAQATVIDLMTTALKNKQVWADLAEVFQQVVNDNINDPIKQLEYLRFLPPGTDVTILKQTARMLGFNVSQDILDFSSNSLLKVVTQLAMYPNQNGTQLFTKFLDFLLNGAVEVINLYTRDYKNFYSKPYGTMITEGGDWYKTTHIELVIALFITNDQLSNVNLGNNTSFVQRIKEIFYVFAPIALVIERFYFEYKINISIGVTAKWTPLGTLKLVRV